MTSAADLLRDRGLRVTAGRVATLDVLTDHPHLTTDEVAQRVRGQIGAISLQAAYHVLDSLVTAGLARRVDVPGSAARYERWSGDNHHHVVCRQCGALSNVACSTQDGPCIDLRDRNGYAVDAADITFWGTCPDCRAAG